MVIRSTPFESQLSDEKLTFAAIARSRLQELQLEAMFDYMSVDKVGVTEEKSKDGCVRELVKRDMLLLGAAVQSYTEANDEVRVTLRDGRVLTGRVLLGCDGIHSAVKA